MSSPKYPGGKNEGKLSSKDITPALKGWDYEPGTISVRKIAGIDGAVKLQMRLDLGVLQMEVNGRPDGHRPHGFESLLEYFESLLDEHKQRNGTELGFSLSRDECQMLRDEAIMYYHRYMSLFILEEFEGVERDTCRNLRVLDLCGRYATDEQDQLVLEQYRPYLVMMNTKARAAQLLEKHQDRPALEAVQEGLATIREFFDRFGQQQAYGRCSEVRVLKEMVRQIRKRLPVDPVVRLQHKLAKAVKRERYEEAAQLRDEIKRRQELRTAGESATGIASGNEGQPKPTSM